MLIMACRFLIMRTMRCGFEETNTSSMRDSLNSISLLFGAE